MSENEGAAAPYRGPDRRGVAQFRLPSRIPTVALVVVGAAFVVGAHWVELDVAERPIVEIGAVAGTLGVAGGVACLLRYRLDGLARGWWTGLALILLGLTQLALDPSTRQMSSTLEVAASLIAAAYFGRAALGPEIDTSIGWRSTLLTGMAGGAVALVPLAVTNGSADDRDLALAAIGVVWLAVGVASLAHGRLADGRNGEGWILPVCTALGLAELVPLFLDRPGYGLLADRWFELCAMALASVGALGGLVAAAVHHRTRALRERIEHEREIANRRRVEESFADRLHEMRSTVVAIEGGVATFGGIESEQSDSTLRAALIAEIRRLRTLVSESPSASGVEAFDVASAIASTVELQRATGQRILIEADGDPRALGRPGELAQVVHGILTNAAKYAPGSEVRIAVRHELDEISLRIEDDGPGIDPEHWDAVFERGYRIDPERAAGSGFGLAVGRAIVRSQDGDLWVDTATTGGAAFVISLPAAPALRVVPGRAEGTGTASGGSAHAAAEPLTRVQEAR